MWNHKFTQSETNFRYEEKLGFQNQLFIIGGGTLCIGIVGIDVEDGFSDYGF